MDSIFDKIKAEINIKDVVERFGIKLDRANKANCPFHNEKTASFSVDTIKNYFKCFGCGESGDSINFVSKLKNIEPIDAAKLIAEMFNISYEETEKNKAKSTIKDYIMQCVIDVGKTDYFEKRGLDKATIRKFCLGYDEYRKAIVIPYSSKLQYYQTRGTTDKVFFKPKTEVAGAEPLFNIEGLRLKHKEPIFIVESPICAMSIYQSGGNAISTCGTGGCNKVIAAIKEKKPLGGLILCFDNDEPGTKAKDVMVAELEKIKINYVIHNISDKCKDPNELLVQSSKKLESNIKTAKLALRKKYSTAKDSFDALELQGAKIEPPTWIIQNVLQTGLTLLCAPSKLGKSWMMLQLCLAVTKGKEFLDYKTNECGCLYYALEDSKSRLQNRMNKVLNGKVAPKNLHFAIQADTVDNGFFKKIKEEITEFPDIKLVIVDTFQKVRGKPSKNDSMYRSEYGELGCFKEFADENKICLLLVHHLRKMADDSDVFNRISGSTAIMAASDSTFVISKKKREDESATMVMTGRDIPETSIVISFDKTKFTWSVDGTSEEMEAKRIRQDYEENIIVQTIKELVKANPLIGWSGSAQDLMKAVFDVTGKTCAESTSGVGKLISKYSYKLHCDGIEHKASKSNTRSHTFKKKLPYMPAYQQTFYDDKED